LPFQTARLRQGRVHTPSSWKHFVEIFEGVPLAFSWRQGGTLVLPAIAHALIDGYRDTLMQ
jgi:hypothetical protein